jgi:hypothetical protein
MPAAGRGRIAVSGSVTTGHAFRAGGGAAVVSAGPAVRAAPVRAAPASAAPA